jgi:uncharacterized protein (DUF849 family)
MTNLIIITAALTGVLATREQCPAIPYTAVEIAEEGRRAVEAGATILHIHARQNDGRPAFDVESYRKIDLEVRKRCPDVIINYSAGAIGISKEERIAHIPVLKPDLTALITNPFKDISFYLEKMNEAGTRPEMECFDTGHINNSRPLIDLGLLKPPYQFSFIMGVLGGIPATTQNLVHQASQLPPHSFWQVIGIGRKQWPLVGAAITMGGNIRVGLEDNFYLPNGEMTHSNGECVENAAQLVRLLVPFNKAPTP